MFVRLILEQKESELGKFKNFNTVISKVLNTSVSNNVSHTDNDDHLNFLFEYILIRFCVFIISIGNAFYV